MHHKFIAMDAEIMAEEGGRRASFTFTIARIWVVPLPLVAVGNAKHLATQNLDLTVSEKFFLGR